jgi:hypothetical protein
MKYKAYPRTIGAMWLTLFQFAKFAASCKIIANTLKRFARNITGRLIVTRFVQFARENKNTALNVITRQKRAKMFSVWVDGAEINDYYLTRKEANNLGNYYLKLGYENVAVRKEKRK